MAAEAESTTTSQPHATMDTGDLLPIDDIKRTIMIPIDGSENSIRAFNWYVDNVKKDGDLLVFVNVIEPVISSSVFGPLDAPPFYTTQAAEDGLEQKIAGGKVLCKEYLQRAKDNGVMSKAFLHIDSKPGRALVDSCNDHNISFVVMGNRGLGTIRRTFMGSVSDYVLHHANRPVMIISPPEK